MTRKKILILKKGGMVESFKSIKALIESHPELGLNENTIANYLSRKKIPYIREGLKSTVEIYRLNIK